MALLGLNGCAHFSPDAGLGEVRQLAEPRLGAPLTLDWARQPADQDRIDTRVAELLAQPLDMHAAVQLALLNNRGLQAAFAELGITEAEVAQAGRLPNPGFSFGRVTRGDEVELERGLHFNLARLLALPLVQRLEARRLQQQQTAVAQQVLTLAAHTRRAWVQAVAAHEGVRYSQQVMQAAEASAELARRMAQVGNFNKLQQAREQTFYADAALNLVRAQQQALAQFRHGDGGLLALDQLGVQLLLERLDRVRHGRLADAQPQRGRREAAHLRHHDENFQLGEGHELFLICP